MKHAYVLQHEHDKQWKLIGLFETRDAAAETIIRLVTQPGFKDTPDGFEVEKREIEGENGGGSDNGVYVLQHVYEEEETLDEEAVLIGIYRTREDAVAMTHKLIGEPRFRHAPDGFDIGLWEFGQIGWEQGYITVAEALAEFAEKK